MSKQLVKIKKNREIREVYSKGKSFANRQLVLYVAGPNQSGRTRFAFVVSKKLGKAHVRNKVRRRLREICRLDAKNIAEGYDLVIIARQGALEADYWKLRNAVRHLLKRAGLMS
ncbi:MULTISPECIES: ribonuclease P protein component [Carboxydocella]|uniref:Ribonuclease P protein component n=2 Tax=Carboxydocella TaxID=178898 RepID=A0A1T4SBL0_9FIRM|nr:MULTISPECIES: ribonuclease P protein component [Carboxydocella]AVX21905.1 ribonuclease P protein component [Carboxydocella thermautotrophica]AVX32307.1 ribonuclease P protein component [Carboxydocella thermautotrophica]SKA25567.1 ribonuclease P protein component [Carboxydocella sporoproducens DSM 16521]GAW30216.1 ribonuclease P protein component [Carboxydocella sp. ULO1]GAW32244.1 ribonuclease P protein component [Carboxydocella sp. JDF658]